MTCVLAARTEYFIYMGADRGLFNTDSGDVSLCGDAKIWKYDNVLVGGAGETKILQKLQYNIDYKTVYAKWKTTLRSSEQALAQTFIPMVDDVIGSLTEDFSILLGIGDELFILEENLAIVKLKNKYEAIGSGGDYAVGAIQALEPYNGKIENKIKKALQISSQYNVFVREPFDVMRS